MLGLGGHAIHATVPAALIGRCTMDHLRLRISFNDARAIIGPAGKPMGRSTLRRHMENDPSFPKPVLIGGKLQFFRDELVDWLDLRPRRDYGAGGENAA